MRLPISRFIAIRVDADQRGCKHDAREEGSGAAIALVRKTQGPNKQETRPYLVP